MHRIVVTAVALFALAPASGLTAQPVDWDRVPHIQITLSSFRIDPATITLEQGQPYVLDLGNASRGGHNLAAPEFFRAAAIEPADAARVAGGKVELAGHSRTSIHLLAPAAGRYRLHCSHFMHTPMGMKGVILVR